MNRYNIIFPHDSASNFLGRCMNNPFSANQSLVDACAAASETVKEFIDSYLEHEEEIGTQFYAELMKRERPSKLFYTIRHIFGERQFKTDSDAGSLKVANESFSLLIPNGNGDGTTRVAIFDSRDYFVGTDLMKFFTIFETPRAWVYSYDCGGEPVAEISGRYAAYYGRGFVALVRLEN